jgi:hypothetical protein
MAELLGITGKEISRVERDALIDDTLLTKKTEAPMRTRAHSGGAKTSPSHSQKARRARTPEHSPAEQKAKDNLSGVQHAKARLILDKRAEAEGKPAQLLRSTRSNTTAPDIWPIKDPSQPKRYNTSQEGKFETSSKLRRSPT